MRRTRQREMTLEEFDAWSASIKKHEAVAEAADETGGPRLSLVPVPEQNAAWPTDLLPPPPSGTDAEGDDAGSAAASAPVAAMPFDGIELKDSRNRLAGWSAARQRLFLETLAETGSVHLASSAARLAARSAYRLRTRSPAFAQAWDAALQLWSGGSRRSSSTARSTGASNRCSAKAL